MRKMWNDSAWKEYIYWQTQDKKTLKKINKLLQEIERSEGRTGKAELLKGDLSGYASVHIDKKNRIVYRISSQDGKPVLEILQCGEHY